MPSVDLLNARTDKRDPDEAAEDLLTQLGTVKPKLLTMFASRDRDQRALNAALRARLPKETRLLGATTGGEIDREGMHTGSVVVAALTGDFEVGLGASEGLSTNGIAAGENAIRKAADQLGARADDLGSKKYVALVIDDGFRMKKEELLLGVMMLNQSLIAVGGGASDHETDPQKQSAMIHVDGEVLTDAVAVTLFRTDAPWAALRSHWFTPTGQTLRITKLDSTARRVLEIDGKPAAKRYAEILGVTVDDLEFGKPKGFSNMSTALRVGREYFIRAAWKPLEDGSIYFANMLEEGTDLELVRMGDMVESTKRFFEVELPARVPSPRAALLFHCSARKWVAQGHGKLDALASTFKAAPPCAGLNVYFETYCGFHINNTLTTLAFGASG